MPNPSPWLIRALAGAALVAAAACAREPEVALDPAQIEKGRSLFQSCAACHDIRKRRNGVGPHLVGIVGRDAGEARDYAYSEAVADAPFAWDAPRLKRFLEDPEAFLPGTNMAIQGYTPDEADALVQYILSRE